MGRFASEWSPDGTWLLVQHRNHWTRVARSGGHQETLAPATNASETFLFSRDGRFVYYFDPAGKFPRNFWRMSITGGSVSRVTQLEGRRGDLGAFAIDDQYLYFTWREDEGDIWVMDVVTPPSP
jgi:hypothetical protein